jgi:hypothetical protein
MQMLNQQPFIQEVLMKNTYKIMKKALIQSLVVNLPMNKAPLCQKIAFQEVAPHSKEKKTKNKS